MAMFNIPVCSYLLNWVVFLYIFCCLKELNCNFHLPVKENTTEFAILIEEYNNQYHMKFSGLYIKETYPTWYLKFTCRPFYVLIHFRWSLSLYLLFFNLIKLLHKYFYIKRWWRYRYSYSLFKDIKVYKIKLFSLEMMDIGLTTVPCAISQSKQNGTEGQSN